MSAFVRAIEGFVGRVTILTVLVLVVFVAVFIGTQEATAWSSDSQVAENAARYVDALAGWVSNQIDAIRRALGI